MGQVSIYIPDALEDALRAEAQRKGQSLSSLMVDCARRQLRPGGWPDGFLQLYGTWQGDFEPPEDPPPREVTLGSRRPAARRK